jgi:curved DNA-binding protein CbpA
MAAEALTIKLRCTSWQQLATIYRRDLSRGSMFLKASTQPPIGTLVRIDLELPSATVIELVGVIVKHAVDPQRGAGVNLELEPLPTKSIWMIESALVADGKMRAQTADPVPAVDGTAGDDTRALTEGEDIAAAETELVRALESECASLRKLNPFLVLGVSYDASDDAVRAAFGELTKRYHPDRFARYQSVALRQIAAEIFILIRDAYRKIAAADGRRLALSQVGPRPASAPQGQPMGAPSAQPSAQPAGASAQPRPPVLPRTVAIPRTPTPPAMPPTVKPDAHETPTKQRSDSAVKAVFERPTQPGPYDAPTNQSGKTAELAHTELAKGDDLAIPLAQRDKNGPPSGTPPEAAKPSSDAKSGLNRRPAMPPRVPTPPSGESTVTLQPAAAPAKPAAAIGSGEHDAVDPDALEALIEGGKPEDALAGYRALVKRFPSDRAYRAGIELCEGVLALKGRDRMEAAQRFEAALELDPSNERAARELAEMRRQATNERKGLLSRLMGKKEPPP